MKKKFLILGSGISSLTLAVLLLREGHEVRVLEQHYLPGGYLHCFKRFGHKFETGGHYVGALSEGLPFHQLLSYLGVYHAEDFVRLDPQQVDVYQFHDQSFTFADGYAENIRRLCDEFPTEKSKITRFFELVKVSVESFPTYYYKVDYDQSVMLKFLGLTLSEMLTSLDIEGPLREVLEAPCILHGVSPVDVAFGVHAIMLDSLLISTHGFSFGGERLAQRFVNRIKELGGDVLLNHRVTRISVADELVTEVHCENGASFTADEYIAGIHPKLLFECIGVEKLRPAFRNRLLGINESVPFVGAYLVLKESLGINPRSNYYYMPRSPREAYRVASAGRENQVGFFATPLRTYSGSGPLPLSVHASCPPGHFDRWRGETKKIMDSDYAAAKAEIFTSLFAKINAQFPGFQEAITDICYSSNLTNSRFNPSPNGSAYGLYHDLSITGARALGPRTHFSNLHLTGQNSLFPGLLGASISGLRTFGFFGRLKDILGDLQSGN